MCGSEMSGLIVGVGGALSGSSTESALTTALECCQRHGFQVRLFGSQELGRLPLYLPTERRDPDIRDFVEHISSADGLLIATPSYHGAVSGLVKNALDYVEDTSKSASPYFNDKPVGLIAVAGGAQGAASAMSSLRTIVHSLRGWPTPFGASICPKRGSFVDGNCKDPEISLAIKLVADQVCSAVRQKKTFVHAQTVGEVVQ